MDERHRQVQNWLDKVFSGDLPPSYEISPRTLSILYELMQKNEQLDRNTEFIIEDLQQKAEEYAAEGERLKLCLSQLGLCPTALSQSGLVSLQTLASTALLLDTKDSSDTSLLLGLSTASSTRLGVEEQRQAEQRLQAQLFKKTRHSLHNLNTLEKSLASLEEQAKCQVPELARKAKQAGFLQSKAREYKKLAHQLNLEVSKSGVDPSLYHHNLVSASENLQDLKSRLQPMRAKLDSYKDLPWDMSLAKVKLEEAKQELASLEAELAKHIDIIHL